MAQADFYFPVYSSANPSVDQLFGREFAQRQAGQRASEVLAAQDTARQEIAARSRLAEAQMQSNQQQQDYNNLFRMAEFRDRQSNIANNNALLKRQLDIEEEYKKGLVAKPGNRTAADQAAFDADSETIANQLNAAYQSKLAIGRAAAKKAYDDQLSKVAMVGAGMFGGPTAEKAKKAFDDTLAILEEKAFNEVQEIATRYYPPATFKVDPFSKKFLPVKTATTPVGGGPQSAPGSLFGPAPTATAGAGSEEVPFTLIRPDGTRQTFSTRDAMDAAAGSAAPPAAPMVSPAEQTVRINVPGGTLEMPLGVANEVEQQLRSGAVPGAVMDQLLKSGRARLVSAAATAPSPQDSYLIRPF